jgi:hypothetical protein
MGVLERHAIKVGNILGIDSGFEPHHLMCYGSEIHRIAGYNPPKPKKSPQRAVKVIDDIMKATNMSDKKVADWIAENNVQCKNVIQTHLPTEWGIEMVKLMK